jgi:single-stranded-DNA-specific exonuclease
LPASSLDALRSAFSEEVGRQLESLSPGRVLWTDGPLAAADFNLPLAEQLQYSAPWGQGFPEPLFDNKFEVLDQRVLNDTHLKLVVRHTEAGEPTEAIAFNHAALVTRCPRLLYRLAVNDFGGRRRTQLVVEHIHSD